MHFPRTTLAHFLVYGAFFVTGCAPATHWPPAVTSFDEIRQLPTTQRDIRAIDIGDAEMELIAERFPGLEYLYVNAKSPITDIGVTAISNLAQLRQVVIEDGSRISDSAIVAFAALPSLTELIIENGTGFTDASIDAMSQKGNLQLLYLSDCSQFTSEAKDRIRRELPSCNIRFD